MADEGLVRSSVRGNGRDTVWISVNGDKAEPRGRKQMPAGMPTRADREYVTGADGKAPGEQLLLPALQVLVVQLLRRGLDEPVQQIVVPVRSAPVFVARAVEVDGHAQLGVVCRHAGVPRLAAAQREGAEPGGAGAEHREYDDHWQGQERAT